MSRRAPAPIPGPQAQAARQNPARQTRQAQTNAHTPTPADGPSHGRNAGLAYVQDRSSQLPSSTFPSMARSDPLQDEDLGSELDDGSSADLDGEVDGEDEEEGEDEGDLEGELDGDDVEGELDPPSRPPSPSLREISSLASWTVSTYKPGCGVRELLSTSTSSFWQSDGPQPHLLTIHFFKVVGVVRMRIYLDQDLDESYTPTRMIFAAGMGEHDLVEFGEWRAPPLAEQAETGGPRGWIEVDLDGVGGRDSGRGYGVAGAEEGWGRDDGKVLRCMCVQIRVLENHQNGKDTHIRGVQLFARDERVVRSAGLGREVVARLEEKELMARLEQIDGLGDGLLEPEWAREIPIR